MEDYKGEHLSASNTGQQDAAVNPVAKSRKLDNGDIVRVNTAKFDSPSMMIHIRLILCLASLTSLNHQCIIKWNWFTSFEAPQGTQRNTRTAVKCHNNPSNSCLPQQDTITIKAKHMMHQRHFIKL